MDQLLSIENGVIKIAHAALSNITGAVTHTGNYTLFGDSTITGTLNVDTIYAKNIVSGSNGTSSDIGNWRGSTEQEINGVGLQWTWGLGNTQLIYRTGNRLWTNANIDLGPKASYKIDDVVVLSAGALGPTIIESNLRKIGTLETLKVNDDVSLGGFAFFNSTFGRVGLGTEDPSLAIDIVENNVNIVVGSPTTNLATIGTASSHDIGIVSDNITRILVKNNGEVIIGDAAGKNGVLRIHGSLYVDNVISDTRVDRSTPLQFQATREQSIYGLGLSWTGTGTTRQLIMRDGPDRLWTSESIDIAQDKSYYINGQPVVTETALGSGITQSNLTKVGVLNSLTVSGNTSLHGDVSVTSGKIVSDAIVFTNETHNLEINKLGITSKSSFGLSLEGNNILFADKDTIEVGSKTNNRKPIKLFGPVSVNVNSPDPSVQFSVNGDIKVADRRFTNSHTYPDSGSFELGDICWNTRPQPGSYIGWVCVSAGNPGIWAPFGEIK